MAGDYWILVCGAREWNDYTFILSVIRDVNERAHADGLQLHVISGAQRAEGEDDNWVGADWLAIEACMELQVPFHGYPAQWDRARARFGRNWRRAGTDRNEWQLRENRSKIREAFAFHDHLAISVGTKDMVDRLHKARVPVKIHAHS